MCQLLGMNCATPTDFCFSFSGFRLRGGLNDKHSDGYGIAIYQGPGLRTYTDTLPAAESPIAEMISKYPIKTLNMMAHIRYATQGGGGLENCHPFQRELWGIHFSFCHNGDVSKFASDQHPSQHPFLGAAKSEKDRYYIPVGDTDSESIFCAILNALRNEYNDSPPTLPEMYKSIQKLCEEIVQGEEETAIVNFLLCCGEYTQFAYSWPGKRPGSSVWNGLFYTIREPPFTTAELTDIDYSVDFSKLTTQDDRVAVITTKPLTKNETWVEMKKGELLMFDQGLPYGDAHDCDTIEKEGRGLCSKLRQPLKDIMIPSNPKVLEDRSSEGIGKFVNQVTRNH